MTDQENGAVAIAGEVALNALLPCQGDETPHARVTQDDVAETTAKTVSEQVAAEDPDIENRDCPAQMNDPLIG